MASSFDCKSWSPFFLLSACERSCAHLTAMPVGMCLIRTAVSTLLTFCPPFPPARIVVISRSSSGMATSATSSGSSGITSTAANDVSRVPPELKGDMRTKRCVPFSERNLPYANRPCNSMVEFLIPAPSPAARSPLRTSNPRDSPHRRYIRSIISAQSCASIPPAPAVMVSTAGLSSKRPLSSCVSSHEARPSSSEAMAALASCTISAASSSSPSTAPPTSSQPSSSRSSSAVRASARLASKAAETSSPSLSAFMRCRSAVAAARSSQIPSALARSSNSASSARFDSASIIFWAPSTRSLSSSTARRTPPIDDVVSSLPKATARTPDHLILPCPRLGSSLGPRVEKPHVATR
mmetsp:Transcript_5060/g.17564  ORF Transcript_5060/g.17564 Transcript_5060/m.17564 type:complete len:352 (+) Transcript_5060:2715-3770(+)